MKDQPKGYYTRFDDKGKDITYSNKDFKEIAVNFIRIEALCNKYHITFSSKSKLYNHLKDFCQKIASLSLPLKAIFSIFIIASKAVYQFFGSRLVFKG